MKDHKITINAPREKVWNILWDDATYPQWTAVFSPGSHAVSDWNEGSKILFVDPEMSGMVSMIETKRPYEFMSFKHLGLVKNGVEDTESEEAKKWIAHENYTLEDVDGKTHLTVNFKGNIPAEFVEMFNGMWPKALEKVKELSESGETRVG